MMRVAAAMMALLVCGVTTAETITVCASGCDYTEINAAIDAASDGDVIQLAAETYYEGVEINTDGKAIVIQGVSVPDEDGPPETVIDGGNSHRVLVCQSGETNATHFANLLIRNGLADGGGLFCEGSSPTITGCTFSNNTANYGGGIFCYLSSNPTITDCTISDNTTSYRGGGIYCWSSSSPAISGCTISNNTSKYDGGGIYCINSCNPTMADCTVSDNTASHHGGGILCNYGCSPTITDCTIMGNAAATDGGGLYCNYASDATISNCTISGNTAGYSGGGIYCYNNSNPTIADCSISGNTAASGGGTCCIGSSHPALTDTVLCGNVPDQIFGSWTDNGGNTISNECPPDCPDVSGDGIVGVDDVLAVVAAWGSDDLDADIDGDGTVGTNDLLAVIGAWGPCE